MQTRILLALTVLLGLASCKTVHTDQKDGVPIALWFGDAVAPADADSTSRSMDVVVKVLRKHGLHPSGDEHGVSVPDNEERRARDVLLTDGQLAESGVFVVLLVPAGSGRRTAEGFEVPAVGPNPE